MTSRPSRPPPSSGSRRVRGGSKGPSEGPLYSRRAVAVATLQAALIVVSAAPARGPALAGARDTPTPLIEKRGAVTIDWGAGTIAAQAGAAADLRIAPPDLARPG